MDQKIVKNSIAHTRAHLLLSEITHRYAGTARPVLNAISTSIGYGEIVVVLGLSGSGKSTLLKIMGGLVTPDQGAVLLAGENLVRPTPRCVLLYQEPLLFPWKSVEDNISLASGYAGLARKEVRRKTAALLALTGLNQFAGTAVQRLSGGQQQRVALARALSANPDVLLLDEPFSSLDPFIRRKLRQELREISRSLGLTIVMVTHDIEEAVAFADRVLILSHLTGRFEGQLVIPSSENAEPGSLDFRRLHAELRTRFEDIANAPCIPHETIQNVTCAI